MNIGIDRHGVLDRYQDLFKAATREWVELGHEVHILSGHTEEDTTRRLETLGFFSGWHFQHVYSIVDHNRQAGTPMELRDGNWWMSDEAWNRSKGDYALKVGLDLHFDDSVQYAPWFPPTCTFVLVRDGFHRCWNIIATPLDLTLF